MTRYYGNARITLQNVADFFEIGAQTFSTIEIYDGIWTIGTRCELDGFSADIPKGV
jgi:hypothetical protein